MPVVENIVEIKSRKQWQRKLNRINQSTDPEGKGNYGRKKQEPKRETNSMRYRLSLRDLMQFGLKTESVLYTVVIEMGRVFHQTLNQFNLYEGKPIHNDSRCTYILFCLCEYINICVHADFVPLNGNRNRNSAISLSPFYVCKADEATNGVSKEMLKECRRGDTL